MPRPCALIPSFNEENEDLSISCIPNALVLFNPVIDNGPGGYGYARIGDKYKEFSPLHNIKVGAPPAIILLGTRDRFVPVETAKYFKMEMEKVGSLCKLILYEGPPHDGFFNFNEEGLDDNRYYNETLRKADEFLLSLKFIG